MKIKKGDNVVVIAGKDRGTSGTIVRVMPRDNKIVIDGVNVVKRHRKPTAQSRTGSIVEISMPIHASNVMLADPKSGKPSRVGITRGTEGKRTRVAKKSGQEVK